MISDSESIQPPWLVNGNRIIPAIEERNRRWSRGLDGRVVWSHVLWIEPLLEILYGEDRHDPEANRRRALRSLLGARVERPALDLLPSIEAPSELAAHTMLQPLLVTAPSADAESGRRALTEALAVLRSVGMDFFVELALGVIAIGYELTARFVGTVPERMTTSQTAVQLLRSAATELLGQWYDAVRYANSHGLAQPLRDFDAVASLYIDSLEYEFHQRLIEKGFSDLTDSKQQLRRNRLARVNPSELFQADCQESVIAELVSYTYPLWDRVRFCLDSPFDGYRSLTHGRCRRSCSYLKHI